VIGGFDIRIYDPVAQTITRYFTDGDHAPPAKPTAEVRKLKLTSEISGAKSDHESRDCLNATTTVGALVNTRGHL
jgi:hypothetical protein